MQRSVVLKAKDFENIAAFFTRAKEQLAQNRSVLLVCRGDFDGQTLDSCVRRLEAETQNALLFARAQKAKKRKDRLANQILCLLYRVFAGLALPDGQIGLIGLPAGWQEESSCLDRETSIAGLLLALGRKKDRLSVCELEQLAQEPYAGRNGGRFYDAWILLRQLVRYSAVSLSCAAVDYALYSLAQLALPVWISYASARAVSMVVNYQLNRRLVFRASGSRQSVLGYVALALFSLLAGSLGTQGLTLLGIGNLPAKLLMDTALFFVNFFVQKKWLFRERKEEKGTNVL